MRSMHFFGSRTRIVEEEKEADSEWRYGKGNIFSPPNNPEESARAIINIGRILHERGVSADRAVMLESQYKKGISVVTEELLANEYLKRDSKGRLIIPCDGLFTMLPDVQLLNKSGDAHAIILESSRAVGILAGSWRSMKKEIFPHMMEHFLAEKIDPNEITIHLGPGLGPLSYSLGRKDYEELVNDNPLAKTAFTPKNNELPNKHGVVKYLLDFPEYVKLLAASYHITSVVTDESKDTFDKTAWKKIKTDADENHDPEKLKEFYERQDYYSARLYKRLAIKTNMICKTHGLESKGTQENPDYNGTGRNLNGVCLKM